MRHLLVILAAVAAMTSCKKETVANEKDAAGTMLTCAVSDSKMSIGQAENDSYPFVWNTNDTITARILSPKGHPLGFPKVAAKYNGQKTCSFKLDSTVAAGQVMRIFFNASHGGDYTQSHNKPFIPAEQIQAAPGAANMHDYTYAWSDEIQTTGADNYDIWLYHAPAFVKININSSDYAGYTVKSAKLISASKNLTGNFSISSWHMPFRYGKAPTITAGEGSKYARTTITNPAKIGTGQSIWMSVLPGTYTDLKIELVVSCSGSDETLIIPGPESVQLLGDTANEINLKPLTFKPIVVLMYDDNKVEDETLVSLCDARGLKVSLALIGNTNKAETVWATYAAKMQNWVRNGHSSIGHGAVAGETFETGHNGLNTMTDDEAFRAIRGNNKAFDDFGFSHRGIAYFTTWEFSERTLRIVDQNYDYGFCFNDRTLPYIITPETDPFHYNRYATDNATFSNYAGKLIAQASGNCIVAFGGHMNRTATGRADKNYSTMQEFTGFLDLLAGKVAAGELMSMNSDAALDAMNARAGKTSKAVTGVALNKAELTLEGIGSSYILQHTFTPQDCTDRKISWTTSDSSVATVYFGKVTAIKEGTATITASVDGGRFTATCTVTVKDSGNTTYQYQSGALNW